VTFCPAAPELRLAFSATGPVSTAWCAARFHPALLYAGVNPGSAGLSRVIVTTPPRRTQRRADATIQFSAALGNMVQIAVQ
jgi:hypothetical protein